MNIWSNLYRHHRWANRVLIDFLSGLGADRLSLTVPGTYGTSLATIRHLVSSDADYVRIIPDTPEVPQLSDEGPFGGWEELGRVADAADSALISYVDGPTEDRFFVDIDEGEAFELATSMLLTQIVHHATDHRSQIRTTLSAHGIDAPDLSAWAWRKSEEGRAILSELSSGRTGPSSPEL